MKHVQNETIRALMRQITNLKERKEIMSKFREIAARHGTLDEIMALDPRLEPEVAACYLDPKSLLYNSEVMNVSLRKLAYLEKRLEIEIKKEEMRIVKRGVL